MLVTSKYQVSQHINVLASKESILHCKHMLISVADALFRMVTGPAEMVQLLQFWPDQFFSR